MISTKIDCLNTITERCSKTGMGFLFYSEPKLMTNTGA